MIFVTLAGASRVWASFSQRIVPVAASIKIADGAATSRPAAHAPGVRPSSRQMASPMLMIRLRICSSSPVLCYKRMRRRRRTCQKVPQSSPGSGGLRQSQLVKKYF